MSATVTPQFQTIMDELKEDCSAIAKGMRGTEQLRWAFSAQQTTADENAATTTTTVRPGKFEFDQWHEIFSRSEAEEAYESARNNSPNSKKQELAVSTAQSDIISSMERDFIARHRTRIRRLAHEATARSHTGSKFGVIEIGLMYYMQEQIKRTGGTGDDTSSSES